MPEINKKISELLIVGGGSAGWLTAGLIAAEFAVSSNAGVRVTLVESPDVSTVGVGEGTWPTMRSTLQKIGIAETDFLTECSATFKQGTKFTGWVTGGEDDAYYHPFTAPAGYTRLNIVPHWQPQSATTSFTDAVTVQGMVCDRDLAPKQLSTPEYAGVLNYAYHLDAGKFADLLKRHCTEVLGVKHILDHVTDIVGSPDEDIRAVSTAKHGDIKADLFIDCTGFAALLLDKHYGIAFLERHEILFNDSALAAQVPYVNPGSPIASQTISAAQTAGWIWDIGLTYRRGIGYTYSSRHTTDDEARRVLRDYIGRTNGDADIEARKIGFRPGHREKFWHRNCVAIGMSAGFLEPLEASALVLIELAGKMIAEEFPHDRTVMDIVANRYNERFRYRWDRIIDFLKLHYVLSQRRDTGYWNDHRDPATIPDTLADALARWRHQAPWHNDFSQVEEVFSAASYQYVLYGMGFETRDRPRTSVDRQHKAAQDLFLDNVHNAKRLLGALPDNRSLLDEIGRQGLSAA